MWFQFCIVLQLCFVTTTAGRGWRFSRNRRARSVCFDNLGCFSTGRPFTNTPHLPQAPHRLGVQFLLYTRHQPSRVRLDRSDQRMREVFDVAKNTRVIIHGYLNNGDATWVQPMIEALLDREDQNVVVVDWGRGARSVNYLQVVANSRVVGAIVRAMLDRWVQMGASPSSLHLIGHSLGAHIAGYAGTATPGVGRITGLDPAGPAFQTMPPEVRLDPTDANFVDVLHTNALPLQDMGLGYIRPCGTADFYPNGGRRQPGCRSVLNRLFGFLRGQSGQEWVRTMGCHHQRAHMYFTHSINTQCPMRATPCQFPHVLQHAHRCQAQAVRRRQCQDCVTMGYDVDLNASGVYHVRTGSRAPFCVR